MNYIYIAHFSYGYVQVRNIHYNNYDIYDYNIIMIYTQIYYDVNTIQN